MTHKQNQRIIPPHGGYQRLLSYQRAEVVYDATVRFCADFLNRRDRTVDQMVQAARSGKQNIVEGSMASGTSKEMELKQTNYLLDQQIRKLEETFVQEGGLHERMTRARLAPRRKGHRLHGNREFDQPGESVELEFLI